MISADTQLFNMFEQIEDDRADIKRANEQAERRVARYIARYQGYSEACHDENVRVILSECCRSRASGHIVWIPPHMSKVARRSANYHSSATCRIGPKIPVHGSL